jgi:hypothetical protein
MAGLAPGILQGLRLARPPVTEQISSRLSTVHPRGLGVGKHESHPAYCSGPFDGLAHEPRRHGVQLVCVVFPGRSGGPGGVPGYLKSWAELRS